MNGMEDSFDYMLVTFLFSQETLLWSGKKWFGAIQEGKTSVSMDVYKQPNCGKISM